MKITLVGATPRFAGGFATWAVTAGHDITVVGPSRGQGEAFVEQLGSGKPAGRTDRLQTEIVFSALPYVCLVDVWQSYGEELVDLSLPVDFVGRRVHLLAGSALEELALARPRVRVVKAFHPKFAGPGVAKQGAAEKRDVLLAADDAAAKGMVAQVFETGGLHAVDFGPLRRARELDALGFSAPSASIAAQHGGRS